MPNSAKLRPRPGVRPIRKSSPRKAFVDLLDLRERPAEIETACSASLPRWDGDLKQVWLGSCMLKEYRQPAPNQIAILDAFQAHAWALRRIDDPIPPFFNGDKIAAKQRLHETIKNLNRSLLKGTIRFHGDGTGTGVRWDPVRGKKKVQKAGRG